MDPTRIQIFRYCGFELEIPMLNDQAFPLPLAGYNFMLSIAATPTPPSGAFGPAILSTSFPGSGSGSVVFVFSAAQTAQLMIDTAYQYSALGQAPGSDPSVLQYGSIQLVDAPAMAHPAPHSAFDAEEIRKAGVG